MTKKKKSVNQLMPSPSNSPNLNINLELDNRALRAKNVQLAQAVAKLQQEKTQQQNQIALLHNEYFKLNSNFVNLKNVFGVIESTTKECFPKLIEYSEMFAKIMHLSTLGSRISDLNKDLRTQRVKPHIVNGHVLNDPTINLSRLNDISHTPPRSQHQTYSRQDNLSVPGPSSSNRMERQINEDIQGQVDQDSNEDQYGDENMVTTRPYITSRRRLHSNFQPINMEALQQEGMDDEETEEEQEEEDISNENDFRSRLITIQEEDEDSYPLSVGNSRIISEVLREMKIYLDPLPKDCLELGNASSDKSNSNLSPPSSLHTSSSESNSSVINNRETVISRKKLNLESNMKSSNHYRKDTFHGSNDLDVSNFLTDTLEQSNDRLRAQYSSNILTPCNVPSTMSNAQGNSSTLNNDLESQIITLANLGLTPTASLTTSTPKSQNTINTSRRRRFDFSSKTLSPTNGVSLRSSNVTKRRGGSEKTKVAQVILKRLSLEKKFSGSPIKKIGDVLNVKVMTRPSDIKCRTEETCNTSTDKDKSPIKRLSNARNSRKEKENIGSRADTVTENVAVTLKKTFSSTRPVPFAAEKRISPRPKRAARPITLKDSNLRKKLRRSK